MRIENHMKKVKLFLLFVIVIGSIGGLLAYKAKCIHVFYCTNNSLESCTEPTTLFSTLSPLGEFTITCSTEAHTSDPCGETRVELCN